MRTKNTHLRAALELARLLEPTWPAISAAIERSGGPTCHVAEGSLADKLSSIETELSSAREERVALAKSFDHAKADYARSPDADPASAIFKRAQSAREELSACDQHIASLQAGQIEVLKMMGRGQGRRGLRADGNGPRSGDWPAGDGWQTVAQELSLADGRNRVNLPLADLLRGRGAGPMAGVVISPSSGLTSPAIPAPFMELARDERHIWMTFPAGGEPLDPSTAAITEYRQKGSRTVTGTVERDPVATTEKAKLGLEIELVTPPLKQFAVVVDEIPAKLFDFIDAFQAFLQNEMAYQVNLALDAHCLAQLAAAAPPVGLEGETLIEQCRNAVAAMRKLGAKPTVLALDPTAAAALDVQKSGKEGLEQYIFATRDTGSSSPLFGNAIVEVPTGLDAPMLLDPSIAGVMYTGLATALADPFSGLDTNEVRLRIEAEALCHVRDVQGVYMIEAEGE